MTRPATAAEVRSHYKSNGDTVRISRAGRVTFRSDGEGIWLEGRWVEEYQVMDCGKVVLI
jgi:hypothetical protein